MATTTRVPARPRSSSTTARERPLHPGSSAREPGRGSFVVSALAAVVGLSLLGGMLIAPEPTRLLVGIVAAAFYTSVVSALLGAVRRRHGRLVVVPVTRLGVAALTALAAGLGLTFLPLLLSVEGATALHVLTVLIYVGIGLLVVAGVSVVVAVALLGERSVVVAALALATMLLVPFFHLGRAVLP